MYFYLKRKNIILVACNIGCSPHVFIHHTHTVNGNNIFILNDESKLQVTEDVINVQYYINLIDISVNFTQHWGKNVERGSFVDTVLLDTAVFEAKILE